MAIAFATEHGRSDYIDAAEFSRLFRGNKRNRNRRKIAAGIHLISTHLSRGYRFHPRERIEDAAAEATVFAIEKIWHFQQKKKKPKAIAYFTILIKRKIVEQLKMEQCRAEGKPPWRWHLELYHKRREKRP